MEGLRFKKTGAPIQVGGMTVKGNANTNISITANSVIEVADTAGAGAYVLLSTSSIGSTVSSGTSGAFFIPPFGVSRPFNVESNTNIRGSAVINVREL